MRRAGLWLAGLVAAATVAPFLYMVGTSLAAPGWSNYPRALAVLPFGRILLNGAFVAACVAAGQVATSAAAAYAFARLRFPGRDRVFLVFLSVLTVPAVVLLVPRFLIIDALGWVDSYPGLISTELV